MKILIFTPPTDQKILSEEKSMTARFWTRKPPALSELIRAQTGRKKETAFAILKVVGVALWHPLRDTREDIEERTGYTLEEIASKEGFETWEEFIDAYVSTNSYYNLDDIRRRHYLIDFEVSGRLFPGGKDDD